mmetsp:Transcript_87647/g.263515  ORF Transcript_87647/g.263515 Transcript_87647/m.263515 type:complete len:81 (+) Transcript_87647:190-432(+)
MGTAKFCVTYDKTYRTSAGECTDPMIMPGAHASPSSARSPEAPSESTVRRGGVLDARSGSDWPSLLASRSARQDHLDELE